MIRFSQLAILLVLIDGFDLPWWYVIISIVFIFFEAMSEQGLMRAKHQIRRASQINKK